MEGSSFHSEWDEKVLRQSVDAKGDKIKDLKGAQTKKPSRRY